jgi:SRSO17 transposase
VIDRAPYLPRDWAANDERRTMAGVPDQADFATKPELAAAMLVKAVTGGVRAAADEVYGTRVPLEKSVAAGGSGDGSSAESMTGCSCACCTR